MSYLIALCNNDSCQTKKVIEMLHVYENEYEVDFELNIYLEISDFLNHSCKNTYDVIFLNVLQGGKPYELDYIYLLHKKNPTAALFSICPTHNYQYYHDLADEAAFMSPPFSYVLFKKNLYKILKDINVKKLKENWFQDYIKVCIKNKEDYIERRRIIYILIENFNITFHTLDRNYVIFTTNIIDDIKQLPIQYPYTFFYANKHCIFNINYLYDLEKIQKSFIFWQIQKTNYYIVTPTHHYIVINKYIYKHLFPQFIQQTLSDTAIIP